MAANKTEVVNMALAILGKNAGDAFDYIEDIADAEDKTAQWSSRIFDRCLNKAIVTLCPPECVRYVASGAVKTAATILNAFPDDYAYIYARPAGCIGMLGVILEDLDSKGREQPQQYLEAGGEIAVITSDTVRFKHLVTEADTTKWSEGLSHVAAHWLAYYLCGPMRSSDEARANILSLLQLAITDAREDIGQGRYDPLTNAAEKIWEID